MGWTKTICCHTRKIHLFAEEWADLVQQRDGLKKECLKYLDGKACLAGVPDVVAGINSSCRSCSASICSARKGGAYWPC